MSLLIIKNQNSLSKNLVLNIFLLILKILFIKNYKFKKHFKKRFKLYFK